MTLLAFVDTETTGLDPDRHEIWEVGLVLADDVGYLDYFDELEWQLPVDLGRADPMALKVGRFRDRYYNPILVEDVQEFAHGFAEITDGAHLVGCVPSFDEERLRKLLRANGECPTWHHHLIDVEAMAYGYIHAKYEDERWPAPDDDKSCLALPYKSDQLSRICGVEPPGEDERHTALGDARWAYRLYKTLVGASS